MIYRRLDANGDYIMGLGPQGFLRDAYAIGQAVKTRLGLLLAEWWEDLSDGLPLFQSILAAPGSPQHLTAVDLLVRERIMGTPGVARIDTYKRTYVNRQYAAVCDITTETGESTTVEVTL